MNISLSHKGTLIILKVSAVFIYNDDDDDDMLYDTTAQNRRAWTFWFDWDAKTDRLGILQPQQ